jgi:hypothetical protein
MKIESTGNAQMLYKGAVDNAGKFTKSKEMERQQAALEKENTVSSFVKSKGSYFDNNA